MTDQGGFATCTLLILCLCVQSLPWLVLTDATHIVTAEGVTIAELPGKLVSIGEEP